LPIFLAIVHAPIFGGAKPVPYNPNRVKYDEWGAAIVALAGPLTNLFIAFVMFGVFALLGAPSRGTILGEILTAFVTVNLGFFVFNMIPLPPLDGSRVLYALAPDFVRRGMEAIERYGIMVIFVLVMIASPVLSRFISGAITFFITVFSHIFGM
jgi:Zn-dependent protease